MIEYVNLFLLLAMFGSTCYVYYKLKKFFYLISILMDSEILDQLTNNKRSHTQLDSRRHNTTFWDRVTTTHTKEAQHPLK